MYKIHPSVYEKADPALLELIEKAKVGNLSDEEYLRYEAGLKALEDYIDFDEMLAEAQAKVVEAQAQLAEAQAKAEEAQAKAEEAQAKATKAQAKATEAQAKAEEAQAKATEAQAKAEEAQAKSGKAQLKAKAEGRTEGKIEVAKRMLNDNLSVELISKFTGLSQDEVDKLR